MYIVPKKANDMMNVGMLECYTVKELCNFLCYNGNLIHRRHRTVLFKLEVYFIFSQGKIQALGQLIMQVIFFVRNHLLSLVHLVKFQSLNFQKIVLD